jgi:hypothetical protein
MARDQGIAARVRAKAAAFGVELNVVEVAGWRERGSEIFNPDGSVDHHTAGRMGSNAPSLNICIFGRSDLPGPLCNLFIARDNTVHVVAAGRANHAGTGGWKHLRGNSSVYGIERENVGTPAEPWTLAQTVVAALCHAALIEGRAGAEYVCRHQEWAPTRKIDTHTLEGFRLRQMVQHFLNPPPSVNPFPRTLVDRLMPGEALHSGQYITSRDGRIALGMQADGNLVEYEYPTALWSSGTDGSGATVTVMQGDGNLVTYTPDGRAVFNTGTHGNPGAFVVVQDDRNLVVYRADGYPLWDSHGNVASAVANDELAKVADAIRRASEQVLKEGSSGEAVWWLQNLLNAKLDGPDIAVDGEFGPGTAAAVKRFQSNVRSFFNLGSKMAVDGIVGPTTWFWLTR